MRIAPDGATLRMGVEQTSTGLKFNVGLFGQPNVHQSLINLPDKIDHSLVERLASLHQGQLEMTQEPEGGPRICIAISTMQN